MTRLFHFRRETLALAVAPCLALAGFLAVLGLRAASVFSFAAPLHLVTSGWEQESLFALWKFVHGFEVYADRFAAPFAAAVFNWGFYAGYGFWTGALMSLLGIGDPYLPTLGRLLTALCALLCAAACAWVYWHLVRFVRAGWLIALALATAFHVTLGPVVGYWAMTVRPDMAALLFEILAVGGFWLLSRHRPLGAAAWLAILAFIATSLKQTSMTGLLACGCYLLLLRRWNALALAISVFGALWVATLILAPRPMLAALFFADYPISFSLERMGKNLSVFVMKALPLFGMTVAVLVGVPWRRIFWPADHPLFFGLVASVVSGGLSTLMAAQSGASENYFFLPTFMLGIFALAGISEMAQRGRLAPPAAVVGGLGWLGSVALTLAILLGIGGATTSLRDQHDGYLAKKACLDRLPRPLFVDNQYLSLPWMLPGSAPLVLSFAYDDERKAGKRFEADGIGGMIAAGRFGALALDRLGPDGRFDGALLEGYQRTGEMCGGLVVFRRQEVRGP